MPARSAGILLYRLGTITPEVLLVHPGGPFWVKRDIGAWSIPKGELGDDEVGELAARREFEEELGAAVTSTELLWLGETIQAGGKHVQAWAVEGDFDVAQLRSNTFELEWPPRSGRRTRFPEVDRAAWFGLSQAAERIVPGQRVFLDRLRSRLTIDIRPE